MPIRPRDTQKAKYYRAEAEVLASCARDLETVVACQKLVDRVQRSLMWRELLGSRGFRDVPEIEVRDGRGRVSPGSEEWPGEWLIRLPRYTRLDLVVLRQMAFLATPDRHAYTGPEFAAAVVELVEAFLAPATARVFRQALARQNVRKASGRVAHGTSRARVVPREVPPVAPKRKARRTAKARSEPQDSQRSRVYRAEHAVWETGAIRFDSMEEVRAYVRRVEPSVGFYDHRGTYTPVTVGDGRGASSARACLVGVRIEVPTSLRHEWVVLHELAHLITPSNEAAHNPRFTRNLHSLVREFMGAGPAATLLRSYEEHGVKVAPAWQE
jgi:putative metallohydrolase (TIGR04338 family)